MKRKFKLLYSFVALAFSVSMMLFGVFAAATPNITISGTVVFTTSASQVRVTGTIIDGVDQNNNAIPYVTGQTYHYFDYTDSEKNTLENWSLNGGETVYFKEDKTGVTDIKLQFEFTNNSPFYTVAKFEDVSDNENITVDYEENVVMDVRGETQATKIATITYSIIDDSKPSTLDINFTVSFDKYLPEGTDFLSLQQNLANYTPLTTEQINLYQSEYEQQRLLNKTVKSTDNLTTNNNQTDLQNKSTVQKTNVQNGQLVKNISNNTNTNNATNNNISNTTNNNVTNNNIKNTANNNTINNVSKRISDTTNNAQKNTTKTIKNSTSNNQNNNVQNALQQINNVNRTNDDKINKNVENQNIVKQLNNEQKIVNQNNTTETKNNNVDSKTIVKNTIKANENNINQTNNRQITNRITNQTNQINNTRINNNQTRNTNQIQNTRQRGQIQ